MFGPDVDAAILEQARQSETEICGVIVDGAPVFLPNIAPDPAESFALKEIPEGTQAIFHSHPGGPFWPTKLDMKQQYASMLPWAIAAFSDQQSEVFWFGDECPRAPLIGRGFRHGVTDCYSIVRDFYLQVHGIELPEFPRDWEWWDDGESLYQSGFEKAGFTAVEHKDVRPGDGFLATIRSKTPNHAGIYLGNGLILHHTAGRNGYDPYRLSTVEPAARWFNFLDKVVTYEKSEIDRSVGQGVWT